MSAGLRLVIFDVDGTLVDSQADILAAMQTAFASLKAPLPARADVLGGVGLSLDVLMQRLLPDGDAADHAHLVEAYKQAYVDLRAQAGAATSSPLYPGARAVLEQLHAIPDVILGVATGKSKRGLDLLIEGHGLQGVFATQQVADFHPSKPHPSMILAAMQEIGVDAQDTVMVGDTSFDMSMAAAAGVTGIGVEWGYHAATALTQAHHILPNFAALPPVLKSLWSELS